MLKNETQIKYFLYARKSSEENDRQSASIGSQIDELTKLAKNMGLNIVKTFTESKSAKRPGRPVFNQMIERVENGEANAILCWKIDRLSRNPLDGGKIGMLLQDGVLQKIQTYERTYLPSDNVLIMQVEQGVANQFIRDLSANVKRGSRTRAQNGWFPGPAKMGYLNFTDPETKLKTIVNDPARFHIVKRMFDLMLTGGYSVTKLWEVMTKEYSLTTLKRRHSGGKPVSRSEIYNILRTPFYYGYYEYPRGEWCKGKHEPMITKEEYDRVQTILGRSNMPRPKEHNFPFTGVMRCPECGCSITAHNATKRQKNGNVHHYVYYHCTKKKFDLHCKQPHIELKNLNEEINNKLSEIQISKGFKDWAIKYLHEIRTTEAISAEDVQKQTNRELEAVNNQIHSLTLKFTSPDNEENEILSFQEYKELKDDLLKQKHDLECKSQEQGEETEKWVELTERTFDFVYYAKAWFENGDDQAKKAILSCLGSNLELKDKKLIITMYPFFKTFVDNKTAISQEPKVITSEKSMNKNKNRASDSICSEWYTGVLSQLCKYNVHGLL